MFTKGTKAALHSQGQEITGLVDKEASENADFQLIMILPCRCIHKNQPRVEIKALWICSIHFHTGKPFQRKPREFPLQPWDRIPSTDHQSLEGVKLCRKNPTEILFFTIFDNKANLVLQRSREISMISTQTLNVKSM